MSTSGGELPGQLDRAHERLGVGDADRDALALLAAGRLDHDLAHLGEERGVPLVAGRRPAARARCSPAASSTRRVTRLSSQRLIATAVVSSESDSRVTIVRPAFVSRISPHAASVTSTRMPRRIASSAMILAYGFRSS